MSELLSYHIDTPLEVLTQTKQELSDLTKEIKKQTDLPCPYPNHKGYSEVRNNLTPEEQQEMKENIKITWDEKIEIVKMKKKFSVLTGTHNLKNIFDGSDGDKAWNTGISGVTYFMGREAEREVNRKDKKLFKDKIELEQFISFFPGETTQEKIFNLIQIFDLKQAGYWDPGDDKWHNVWSIGYAYLSMAPLDRSEKIYGIKWNNNKLDQIKDFAEIYRFDQQFPSPFIAYEE